MKLKYWAFNNFFGSKSSTPKEPDLPEPETTAFINRVIADGGKVNDEIKLDNFFKAVKSAGKYSALQFAVSKQFGYKLTSGNITKIYDASKNGNDLAISIGAVPEDLSNSKFALFGASFKRTGAAMDLIGDKFTISTRVNHPNPNAKAANYFIGFGELWARIGGTAGYNIAYLSTLGGTKSYSSESQSYNNINDGGVDRLLSFRHNKNVVQSLTKDGSVISGINSGMLAYGFVNAVTTITYGNRTDENIGVYADCYLNDSFLFNDYLTDAELSAINNI